MTRDSKCSGKSCKNPIWHLDPHPKCVVHRSCMVADSIHWNHENCLSCVNLMNSAMNNLDHDYRDSIKVKVYKPLKLSIQSLYTDYISGVPLQLHKLLERINRIKRYGPNYAPLIRATR